jgi:hypothetical protein
MADTLITRVTGAAPPAANGRPVVPVTLNLTMSTAALLAGADDPAWVEGHGPIPADLARELIADSVEAGLATWLRRLFVKPGTGELVAMDSRARLFPAKLARFIGLRDQTCRTPWCDAPIRHRDHVIPHEHGGPTSAGNGQGTCEACNHAKQAPGWHAQPRPGPRHTVQTTTPTGHTYTSTPPPQPGTEQAPRGARTDAAHIERRIA